MFALRAACRLLHLIGAAPPLTTCGPWNCIHFKPSTSPVHSYCTVLRTEITERVARPPKPTAPKPTVLYCTTCKYESPRLFVPWRTAPQDPVRGVGAAGVSESRP